MMDLGSQELESAVESLDNALTVLEGKLGNVCAVTTGGAVIGGADVARVRDCLNVLAGLLGAAITAEASAVAAASEQERERLSTTVIGQIALSRYLEGYWMDMAGVPLD